MIESKESIILVVDDSTDAREGLSQFLKGEGYKVNTASSGEEAVEIIQKSEYQLVVTDLKMQDIDGLDVLKKSKEIRPETEVILMTAYGSIETAVLAMKEGAYDYITKPLNLDEILLVIENCLEKERLARQVRGLKELVNLYEVSRKISSVTDLDELLSQIITSAADALEADGGSIMLYSEKENSLIVRTAAGSFKHEVVGKKFKLGERFAGRAAELAKPLLSEEIREQKWFREMEKFEDINSGMSVPMIIKDRLVGTVNLKRTETEKKFTRQDVRLLSIFAQQAAVSIQNSSLLGSLRREKEKLSTLFSDMADGAVLTDEDFHIIMINRAGREILGISPENPPETSLPELTAAYESSIKWKNLTNSTEKFISFELQSKLTPHGCLAVNLAKISGEDEGPLNYIFTMRDISEKKQEETVKKNFLRMMSHKLRTPLTSIIGNISLLEENQEVKSIGSSVFESVQSIKRESEVLSSLIDKLLRFTLLETEELVLHREEISPLEVVESVLNSFTDLGFKNIKIKITGGLKKLPAIYADKEKIKEALENLIENALKFNSSENKKLIFDGRKNPDSKVVISVSDNGPGIPEKEQQRVFEKYHQIEKYFTGQVEGMGLGLALVRQIAHSHGGEVELESTKGKGSTFSLLLPASKSQQ